MTTAPALTSVILGSSSLLTGAFFVNWAGGLTIFQPDATVNPACRRMTLSSPLSRSHGSAVDHRVIWQIPTEASIREAVTYYHDVLEGPQWLNAVLTGIATLAVGALLLKLTKGTQSSILFDGGSLFLFSAAIFIHSQNIQTSMQVLAGLPRKAPALSPAALGAISQIASAHAIIAVTLTGVVALQGAQYYSERQLQKEISKELRKIETAQKASAAKPVSVSTATKAASQTTKKRK